MRQDLHLTEQDKNKIRNLYIEGVTLNNLTVRFKVSRKHIQNIVRGVSRRGLSLDFSRSTSPGYRNV